MQLIVDKLKFEGMKSSTQRNYYCVWKGFNDFFIKLDIKPTTWEDRLTLYIGYLIENHKQSSTIKSYVSAIKAILMEDNYELNHDRFLLASLTRACKYKNDCARTRLPIHKAMLHMIIDQVSSHFNQLGQIYLCRLYRALFISAYYGMLRVGEMTTGNHPVLATDVHVGVNKRKILFILRTSKTQGKDKKPQLIKICSTLRPTTSSNKQFAHTQFSKNSLM